jgi:HNH endonuclease
MSSWIIPNNSKDYDIHEGLVKYGSEIEWTKKPATKSRIATGDIVYIYATKPVMAITMKFIVTNQDVAIPAQGHDNQGSIIGDSWFKIRFLQNIEPIAFKTLIDLHILNGNVQTARQLKADQEDILNRYLATRDSGEGLLPDNRAGTSIIRKLQSNQNITTDEIAEDIAAVDDLSNIEELLKTLHTSLPPQRFEQVVYKVARNPKTARLVKESKQYICEICGRKPFIQKNGKPYAEADHIQQLGGASRGLDTPENIRCLCAQCHAIITCGSDEVIKELLRPTKWQL